MRRAVFHSWVQGIMIFLVMMVFVLISVSMFTVGWESMNDPFSIALYSVIGVFGLIGMWLGIMLGVAIDSKGVQIRRIGVWKTIPWTEIDTVTVGQVGDVYGPVLRLKDGGTYDVESMKSYSEAVARERTELLASYRPPAQ